MKNKITIDLPSLLRDVVKNIWIVVLCALIGYMGIYIGDTKVYTPQYTAVATLVVNSRGATSTSLSSLSVTREMAGVLVNLFSQQIIKDRAAQNINAESFDGDISASVSSNTNFISLSVTSDAPVVAYDLLCSVIEVYPEISEEIFENASISVVRMPSVPSGPSNSAVSKNQNLIITGIITLCLAAIVILSVMRDTIKNQADFETKTDAVLLGTVMHEKKRMSLSDYKHKRKKGLLIHSNAYMSLRFTESFHKIAARLEHLKSQEGAQVFAITSVAENEGKSTCAANIAVSLADRGNRVILIDLDGKKPALFKIFSQKPDEKAELTNLFNHKISKKDFRFKPYKKSSLLLALNTKPYPQYYHWLENGEIEKFIEVLKTKADFIIIDCAPVSVDSAVTDIIKLADNSIVVVRTDVVLRNRLNDTLGTLEHIGNNLAGCVLNDIYPDVLPYFFTGNDYSNYYGKKSKYGNYYGHYNA